MRALVDEDEPRIDGLLRHRLHYLPDERWLDLLDVRWVLTNSLQDATVEGVPFDRPRDATAGAWRALHAARGGGARRRPWRCSRPVSGRRRSRRRRRGAAHRVWRRRPATSRLTSAWANRRTCAAPPGEVGGGLPHAVPARPAPAQRGLRGATAARAPDHRRPAPGVREPRPRRHLVRARGHATPARR